MRLLENFLPVFQVSYFGSESLASFELKMQSSSKVQVLKQLKCLVGNPNALQNSETAKGEKKKLHILWF